jgi:hypothetical protein
VSAAAPSGSGTLRPPSPPSTRADGVSSACRGAALASACHLQQCRTSSSPCAPSALGRSTSVAGRRHCRGKTSRRASRCLKKSTTPGCIGHLDLTGLGGCSSLHALRAAPLARPPSWRSAPP